MRILIYGINYKPEIVGIGKYTGEMAEWLSNDGNEVRVICAPEYYPKWKSNKNKFYIEELNNIKVFRCPLFLPKKQNGIKRIIHLLSFSISSVKYLLVNISFKPDLIIVIAPSFLCAPLGLLYSFLSGHKTKSWIHIQDLEIDLAFSLKIIRHLPIKKLLFLFEKSILKRFDYISAISQSMRETIINKGITNKEIFYIPNWIEINSENSIKNKYRNKAFYKQKYNLNSDSIIVMYSGTLNDKQDINLIIKAVEYIGDKENIFWFFSTEGKSKNKLINSIGNKKNVKILPLQKQEKLEEWLNFADIHIIPQKKGTDKFLLPSKVMAIIKSGSPFIATASKYSELGEITEKMGIRVNPDDHINFSEAILKLSSDKLLRKRLGNSCKDYLLENFEKNNILQKLSKKIKKI